MVRGEDEAKPLELLLLLLLSQQTLLFLCCLPACLPVGGLCFLQASQLHGNLSQLVGQDLNPSSILSLRFSPSK